MGVTPRKLRKSKSGHVKDVAALNVAGAHWSSIQIGYLSLKRSPHAARRWLEATDAAERRRNADAAANVAANAEQRAPSSDESPLPSRWPSAGLLEVVGIEGLTIDGVPTVIAEDETIKQKIF